MPLLERTVVLSPLLKPTIAGREPSKDRFGNYSDPQSEICFGRDALCTAEGATACDPIGPDPSLPGTANVFEPTARPHRGRSAAGSHWTRRWREMDSNVRFRATGPFPVYTSPGPSHVRRISSSTVALTTAFPWRKPDAIHRRYLEASPRHRAGLARRRNEDHAFAHEAPESLAAVRERARRARWVPGEVEEHREITWERIAAE
jgi:hypothetical protein